MADDRFLDALWAKQAALGLTARQLASVLGVHESTISLLRSGGREPGRRFIDAVLGVYPELVGFLLPIDRRRAGADSEREDAPAAVGRSPPVAPSTAR